MGPLTEQSQDDKVWNDIVQPPQISIHLAPNYMHEGKQAQEKNDHSGTQNNVSNFKWYKPYVGYLNCNLVAINFVDKNFYGIGICIHDNNGDFLQPKQFLSTVHLQYMKKKHSLSWRPSRGFLADCKFLVECCNIFDCRFFYRSNIMIFYIVTPYSIFLLVKAFYIKTLCI